MKVKVLSVFMLATPFFFILHSKIINKGDICLMALQRRIIHIDMDAFFASVEQRDNAVLRGKPIAVGHDGPRGVVATASYEARRWGVHSAMSVAMAKRLCPQLIVVEGRYSIYKEVSAQMHQIFHEYTDIIEPISLDEAFLDVTENKPNIELAVDIAREIKEKIQSRLNLTASAGVSYCKLLAKIASDMRKPNGLTTIHPLRALDFIAQLQVEKLWGVGPRTAELMHNLGIFSGADLRRCSLPYLTMHFGKMGAVFYGFARGIDTREVTTYRERKSVGCEQTFLHDIAQKQEAETELVQIAIELERRLNRANFVGTTLTLKAKHHDFTQHTRSFTATRPLLTVTDIVPIANQLLSGVDIENNPVRLLGLSVSNPHTEPSTMRGTQLEIDFGEEMVW